MLLTGLSIFMYMPTVNSSLRHTSALTVRQIICCLLAVQVSTLTVSCMPNATKIVVDQIIAYFLVVCGLLYANVLLRSYLLTLGLHIY